MMVRRVWGSLGTRYRRLLILIAVAAMLPMAIYGSMQTWLRASAERRAVDANNLEEAQRLALQVDNELMAETNALRMLSLSHDLDIDDLRDFYDLARRAHFENKLWHSVIIIDPRTDLIRMNTLFPYGTRLEAVRDPQTVTEVVETHTVVIGAPTPPGPIPGTNKIHPAFVPLRVPVMRRDEVHYILSASMAPDRMRALLWNTMPPGLGGDSYLVDPNGLIVARNRSPAMFAGLAPKAVRESLSHHEGTYRSVTTDGREEVFAFATAPFSHWSVHLGIPVDQYNAPLRRSLYLSIAGMVLSGILILGLVMMIWREIVRQRREEDTLQSARRMEAVGQLTAGVAHDFNNLLTTVIGNIEIIEARVQGKSLGVSRNIKDALKAAEHGAKMTRQLLSFARKQMLQPEPLDINEVVRDVDQLINQTVVGYNISVHFDLCHTRCSTVVDLRELSLSILNLVMNARDAMPDGGNLTIKTTCVDLPIGKQFDDLQPGRYAVFSVIDTGTGMTEEVMAHAFEPFFTTKEIGKGTGLGLSQVYGIVKQSRGTVRLKSEVGHGSEVEIWLPEIRPAG